MFGIANNTEFLTTIGIADAPEETKAKLIADIEELAKQRLSANLAERLTESQIAEFDSITDEKQAANWLAANVPDFSDIITGIVADLQNDILAHKTNISINN